MNVKTALKNTLLFSGAAGEIVDLFSDHYDVRTYSANQRLFRSGSKVDGLFVVLVGQVSLLTHENGLLVHQGSIGPGQALGEFELLTDETTFVVEALAMAPVIAVFIPEVQIRLFLGHAESDRSSRMALNLCREVARKAVRTAKRLAQSNLKSFPYITAQAINTLLVEKGASGEYDSVPKDFVRRICQQHLGAEFEPGKFEAAVRRLRDTGVIDHNLRAHGSDWCINIPRLVLFMEDKDDDYIWPSDLGEDPFPTD